MSDNGFDPCECMWNHLSMQHLLSILRQSQSYCTDIECFSISRIPGPRGEQESSDLLFTFLIIGFIILMYIFRPSSMRLPDSNIIKNRGNEPGSHHDPPPSPTD